MAKPTRQFFFLSVSVSTTQYLASGLATHSRSILFRCDSEFHLTAYPQFQLLNRQRQIRRLHAALEAAEAIRILGIS